MRGLVGNTLRPTANRRVGVVGYGLLGGAVLLEALAGCSSSASASTDPSAQPPASVETAGIGQPASGGPVLGETTPAPSQAQGTSPEATGEGPGSWRTDFDCVAHLKRGPDGKVSVSLGPKNGVGTIPSGAHIWVQGADGYFRVQVNRGTEGTFDDGSSGSGEGTQLTGPGGMPVGAVGGAALNSLLAGGSPDPDNPGWTELGVEVSAYGMPANSAIGCIASS